MVYRRAPGNHPARIPAARTAVFELTRAWVFPEARPLLSIFGDVHAMPRAPLKGSPGRIEFSLMLQNNRELEYMQEHVVQV